MDSVPKDILRLDKLQEYKETFELRRSGLTYKEIGERLGITPAGARRRVQQAISKTEQLVSTEAYDVIQRHMDTLDAVIDAHIEPAMEGDTRAADVVIKALQRQAKLLGIDASERAAIGIGYAEIIAKMREAGRKDLLERIAKGEDPFRVVASEIEVWATSSKQISAGGDEDE